jgi:cyclic pyranopterin phosphate synthase
MIDISSKTKTERMARASVRLRASVSLLKKIKTGRLAKGDALAAAQVAGILATKNTPRLVPLCHPVKVTHAAVDYIFKPRFLEITACVKAADATGVEMEALAACAAAALTVYDMAKAEEPGMVISELKLLKKTGGKSDFRR